VRGTGSGTAVKFEIDSVINDYTGNGLADWSEEIVAGAYQGQYGPNRTVSKVFSPTVQFATQGDAVFTYNTREGRWGYTGQGYWFDIRLDFNTNAYTTAAGEFTLQDLPLAVRGLEVGLNVGRLAKITFTAGYVGLSAIKQVGGTHLRFFQEGSGVAAAALTTANVPPSTNNITFTVTGFITLF
jgi:hypothetical protein